MGFQIPKRHFEYKYEEAILLRFQSERTGNVSAGGNQRVYFDSTASLTKGKNVVAITIPEQGGWNYNGTSLIATNQMPLFVFTLVNEANEVVLWNYPIRDLFNNAPLGSFGKTRILNTTISFKNSFILSTTPFAAGVIGNVGLLFNFYTTD